MLAIRLRQTLSLPKAEIMFVGVITIQSEDEHNWEGGF
jgi:hypothetical protein